MQNRTYNTVRNIVFGIISKCSSILLPFISRTILIYKLGSEYVGLGSLFTSILQVLSVTELGFASAISYTMYKPIADGDIDAVKKAIVLLKTIYKIVGCIILILGLILLPFLKYLIKADIPSDVNIYILFLIYLSNTVVSYFFYGYKNSILSANQRYDVISKTETIVSVIRGITQILVLLLFSNYYLYAIALPIFTIVSNLIVNHFSTKMFPELSITEGFSLKGIKNIAKQIGGIAIGRVSLMCRNSFDSIILSALIGLNIVGMYSNYYMIMSSITAFAAIIMTSMGASVGNSLATEPIEKNEHDHIKFDFYFELIIAFCTICLFTLYQPFMHVWVGDKLMFPWHTMVLFCSYFYVTELAQIRSVYSEAAGLWWNFKYLSIGEMIANLVLNIVLGQVIGVDGIIIATIITAFASSFIGTTLITYKKLFKCSSKRYFLRNAKYGIVTAVGCVICYYIFRSYQVKNILNFIVLVVLTAILAVLYLAAVYLSNKTDRALLREFAGRFKRK